MESYTLKSNNGLKDISFTIADLQPVKQKRRYSFQELTKFIDNSQYQSVHSFEKSYQLLYKKKENKGCDFFKIKNTNIIVIPGSSLFPTLLNENDI